MNLYRITGLLAVVKEGYETIIPVDIQALGDDEESAAQSYTDNIDNYDRLEWLTGPVAEVIEKEEQRSR